MGSRILLNLLLLPKFRLSSARLRTAAAREQGFSLAVVLIALLSVMVAGVTMANRTQTGQLAATLSSSNREAREAADAGITHILSEWNRKENRGVLSELQPMTAWQTTNNALKNPCNNKLTPTATATSNLAGGAAVAIDANRSFRLTEVIFRDGANQFVAQPGDSTKAPTPPFTPSEIDIVVEGIYERGNNTNKAQATKRLILAQLDCPGGGGSGGTGDGFFAFGGNNPGSTLSFNRPLIFYDNNGKIDSKLADNIICLPITASTDGCPPSTAKGIPAGITITTPDPPLSSAEKAKLNPPTFASIAEAEGKTVSALTIKSPITFDGDEANCIQSKGASHCRISSINLNSGNITVDTTKNPVYLYVDGNITLGGKADIVHNNNGNPVTSDKFTSYPDYQETTFRFQIRGQPVTESPTSQTFKLAGNPSANLFFWAPTATLDLRGSAGITSALFVNSLTTKGSSSKITLVGIPQSFIDSTGFPLGGGGAAKPPSLVARSTIFTKFF